MRQPPNTLNFVVMGHDNDCFGVDLLDPEATIEISNGMTELSAAKAAVKRLKRLTREVERRVVRLEKESKKKRGK